MKFPFYFTEMPYDINGQTINPGVTWTAPDFLLLSYVRTNYGNDSYTPYDLILPDGTTMSYKCSTRINTWIPKGTKIPSPFTGRYYCYVYAWYPRYFD